jgi:hypothetical protein
MCVQQQHQQQQKLAADLLIALLVVPQAAMQTPIEKHINNSMQVVRNINQPPHLSSFLLTSSSSHWKFCRFWTHSKNDTTTPGSSSSSSQHQH